jgi:VanZ family protein
MTRHLVWSWIVIAIYGGLEEITQPIVGRVASVIDWLADVAGAAIGLLVFVIIRQFFQRDRMS